MKILLIAGHGDGDPGACGCGYKEAELTRTMVSLIKTRLAKYADVAVHDTSKNAFKVLNNGGSINFKGYDYVFEVHFNAFNGSARGTEIWVTTKEKGVTVEQAIVKKIAALGFANRGVKRKNFLVINRAKSQGVSAALLETCFIDNAQDMAIWKSKTNQIADAIVSGIVEGFGLKTNDASTSNQKIVQEKAGLDATTIAYLAQYKYADALFDKLAKAMK